MIRFSSEKELLDTFRLLDRDQVQLPKDLRLPVTVKDYIAWSEPSGHRVYLIFHDPQKRVPFGIVFRKNQSSSSVATMCEWCHSVRSSNDVSLLTADASHNRRVGLHLCHDLSCKEKAESLPGVMDFHESLTTWQKVRKIVQKMADFSKQNLF